MKTQKNISNLGKLGLAVLASMALVNGTMKAESNESASAVMSLDSFAKTHEADLKYNAPVVDIEVEAAEESLDIFAESNEASLKYVASEYTAAENLEMIAASFEAQLKYQAPAEDAAVESVPAMEKLEMLAEATLSNLKYQAPVNAENEVYDVTDYSANDMMADNR